MLYIICMIILSSMYDYTSTYTYQLLLLYDYSACKTITINNICSCAARPRFRAHELGVSLQNARIRRMCYTPEDIIYIRMRYPIGGRDRTGN